LRGILNTFSSVQVMKILEPSIFTRFNHFVFDYEELTFIDSMGLSAMVIIFKRIESEQGTISVINVKDSIRTVFEITKVIRKIPILPTMEDALKQIEERKDNKE
jgi:anti-anti-sigma factor